MMPDLQIEELQRIEALSDSAFAAFGLANEVEKLEEAIERLSALIAECVLDDQETVGRLSFKFARCLQARFERRKPVEDISNAIIFATNALNNLPASITEDAKSILLAERFSLLCKCLVSQGLSKDCNEPGSLENACSMADETLEKLEASGLTNNPVYFAALRQTALCQQLLWDRYEKRRMETLLRSLSLSYKLLNLMNSYMSVDERAQILGELSLRLLRAHKYSLDTGESLFQDAVPESGIKDEKSLGERAIQAIQEADSLDTEREITHLNNIMAFLEYLEVLPREHGRLILGKLAIVLRKNTERFKITMRASLRSDIMAHALNYYGLSRYAAAAALEVGEDSFTALKILENGRDITGATEFAAQHCSPSEVEKYTALKQKLKSSIERVLPYQERVKAATDLQEFENNTTGNQNFTLGSVMPLASDGAIVVVNITTIRSDAFIITPSSFHSLLLPKLIDEDVCALSWKIQWRLAAPNYRDRMKLRLKLQQMLDLLWRNGIKTILDDLNFKYREDNPSYWPHICWIPTGILSLYPIGSSGLGLGKPGNTFNRVISTYASSIKSILIAASRVRTSVFRSEGPEISVAVVAMTETKGLTPKEPWNDPADAPSRAGWSELEYSENEARVVRSYFPSAVKIAQPKTATVIKLLSQSPSIVHFSCHGHVNFIKPSESMLLFEDGKKDPLFVKDIRKLGVHSKLAVLSACWTANSGCEGLQDEPNHMMASLYAAGFQVIVGGLWYIRQDLGKIFSEEFYRYLAVKARGEITTRVVGEAVHIATRIVAESTRTLGNDYIGDPTDWAPFICFGI